MEPQNSEHELHSQLHAAIAACVGDHSELAVGKILGRGAGPGLLIPEVENLEADIRMHALENGKGLRHSYVGAIGREHAGAADEAWRVTERIESRIGAALEYG